MEAALDADDAGADEEVEPADADDASFVRSVTAAAADEPELVDGGVLSGDAMGDDAGAPVADADDTFTGGARIGCASLLRRFSDAEDANRL